MKEMKLSIMLLLTSIFIFSTGFTSLKKWKLIGQKEVNFGPDWDVLKVNGNDIFKEVKIKVTDAGINMIDMNIYFDNGDKMNVAIKKNFNKGEESRIIDLPGNNRRIDRFEFLYDTKGLLRGKANILVFGRR